MTRFYESLADSLYENVELNEAWSESMPEWLKRAMSWSAQRIDKHAFDKLNRAKGDKISKYDYVHDYQQPRNEYVDSKSTYLAGAFFAKGIDPAQCEYVEREAPTNARDPLFKSGDIPIWGFKLTRINDDSEAIQAYAKGMNDLEKITYTNPLIDNMDVDWPFKSISIKKLSENCDYFCYIPAESLSKMQPKDFEQIRKDRDKSREGAVERGTPGADEPAYLYTPDKHFGYFQRDKSGYVVVPPADKYARILRRSKAKKYANVLEDFHDELVTAWDEIIAGLNAVGPEGDSWVINATSRALSIVNEYIEEYKRHLHRIDVAAAAHGIDTDDFYDGIVSILEDVKRDSQRFKQRMNDTDIHRAATLDF